GYDLKNAKDALLVALNNKDTSVQALYVLSRFPTQEMQQRLAGILLDKDRADLHVVAAKELNRHLQKNGLMLPADQINLLREMETRPDVPAPVRVELAILVGTLRTTPQQSG